MKKFDFTIDKGTLGEWVNDMGQELLSKEILNSETTSYIEIMPDVKYKKELKYLDSTPIVQAYSCGTPTTSGTTSLTSKDIEVKHFMVYQTLCPSDLNDTALSLSQSRGLDTDLPFEGQYATLNIKNVQKTIENEIWVKTSGSTHVGGFLNQFDEDGDVVDYTFDFGATGHTDAELIAGFWGMIDEIPEEITGMEDLTMFMGHDLFRKLSRAFLNTGNVLLQKFDFNGVDVFEFPGAENVKIRPVNGLNKSNNTDQRVVITPASNLVFATDLFEEETQIKMWFSDDDQQFKFFTNWKSGQTYKFSEYVVVSKKS